MAAATRRRRERSSPSASVRCVRCSPWRPRPPGRIPSLPERSECRRRRTPQSPPPGSTWPDTEARALLRIRRLLSMVPSMYLGCGAFFSAPGPGAHSTQGKTGPRQSCVALRACSCLPHGRPSRSATPTIWIPRIVIELLPDRDGGRGARYRAVTGPRSRNLSAILWVTRGHAPAGRHLRGSPRRRRRLRRRRTGGHAERRHDSGPDLNSGSDIGNLRRDDDHRCAPIRRRSGAV